ncbi:MAG: N-ethylammeline chlorohydrolase [Alteromonadaceae bacterium]|nr:N-ethylammeline chlorohydrolase [Alteromonadaceae bacterium]|tara:strand:- start:2161 stop:3492 length:1332 start_codon:yes stop_codon:yes gene_type:complete
MTDALRPVDLLISARWVVPVIPAGVVLDHHSVAVDAGRIIDLCPTAQALERYNPGEHVELRDHLLSPGLINMHGHAAMSLFRGLADDLPLMTWLNDHIWPAEGRFVDEKFAADGTLLAMAEMLRCGTTFFSDMYFFPDVTAEVAQQHRMRAQICIPVLDFPTNWASGPDEYIQKGLAVRESFRASEFIQVAFGPHAPYTVSDEPLLRVATLAEQVGANIQIHLHETAHEIEEAMSKTGMRPLRRLAELGLLSPALQAVHMTQLDDYDIQLLAETGTQVIHCPESNLKLASGFCPVDRLQQAGVNVCLGTDGAASNNDHDLLGEMRTAALLGKAVANDAAAVSAHQVLAMATVNAARALGRESELGSIETGKYADLIAIDMSDPLLQPVYDPVAHLVYSTNSRQVSHSWINGEIHLRDGELLRIDLIGLRDRVGRWSRQIAKAD